MNIFVECLSQSSKLRPITNIPQKPVCRYVYHNSRLTSSRLSRRDCPYSQNLIYQYSSNVRIHNTPIISYRPDNLFDIYKSIRCIIGGRTVSIVGRVLDRVSPSFPTK